MVNIISDSTCDLSSELLDKYDISIIPLHILLGEDEYEDGIGIKPEEIYAWCDANQTTPKTSASSIERAMEVIKPFTDEGREVICFSISQSMSTSYNVLNMAAAELGAENLVTVIDSANLSTGIGLLVLEAAIMAKEGKSAKEISLEIEALKPRVRASFVVDTLLYLHRGGRCSGLTYLAGSALKIHPVIIVKDGSMQPGKKYRGKLEKVLLDYASEMEADLKKAKADRVFITHSGCDADTVEAVRAYLKSLNIFNEILETRAGGVVSSHCGPGTLGVLFIE